MYRWQCMPNTTETCKTSSNLARQVILINSTLVCLLHEWHLSIEDICYGITGNNIAQQDMGQVYMCSLCITCTMLFLHLVSLAYGNAIHTSLYTFWKYIKLTVNFYMLSSLSNSCHTKNVEGCIRMTVSKAERCKCGSVHARNVIQWLHKCPQPYIFCTWRHSAGNALQQ